MNMNWNHGDKPQINYKFNIKMAEFEEVCKIEVTVDSFLEQVEEELENSH